MSAYVLQQLLGRSRGRVEAGDEVPRFARGFAVSVFRLAVDSQEHAATGKPQPLADIFGVGQVDPKKTSLPTAPFFSRV